MDEWDAQKMLDLYIHDYLVRKNMHTTADILAKEADIQPKSVVINPPEGFLSEWWSLFWDVYSSRIAKTDQSSSSKAPVDEGTSASQNAVPDASSMLQNISPAMPMPMPMPNLLHAVNPASVPMPMSMPIPMSMPMPMPMPMMPMPMPMPEMGSLLPNAFPAMMPNMDFGANPFGQTSISISDNSMRQDQMMTDLIAQRVREQQHPTLPPRSFDAAKSNVLNVDQLANMLPMGSSSSRQKKKGSSKRQLPVTSDFNYGAGFRRAVTSELPPHAPKLLQDDSGHSADAGSSASSNSACPDSSS